MNDAPHFETAPLPPGTRMGELEILKVIGEGGFGIVYLANDLSLDREVALKEYLPASLAARSQGNNVSPRSDAAAETFSVGLRSFVNEAKLLARFDHPSLLKVHRFWEENGTAYMMMPVLRGMTLRNFCREHLHPANESWLRALLDPLLSAIEMLHREGVYHRDIAPDNIMVDPDGRPILLDFGAARRVIENRTQALTTILKPGYAPIEQYAESDSLSQGPWTDLYALGATLHFVLLGRAPEPSVARVMHDSHPRLAAQAVPGCSVEFLRAIDWMLEVRPVDRPQSVAELRAVLAGGPARTALPSPRFDVASPVSTSLPFERAIVLTAAQSPSVLMRIWHAIVGRRAPRVSAPLPPPSMQQSPSLQQPSLIQPSVAAARTVILGTSAASAAPETARQAPSGSLAQDDRTMMFRAGERADVDLLRSARPANGTSADASAPAVALTVTAADIGAYIGRKVVLGGEELTIGRDTDGFHLPDPQWSRRHAAIQRTPEGISIRDLGSSNGTYVNGRRLAVGRDYPVPLGALIRIGSTTIALTLAEDAGPLNLTGTELADIYDLTECLQASPKGVLYRARKKRSGREVAIKILSPDYASFPGYRQHFAREAAIAARLQHPHICSVDDYGETDVVRGGRRSRVPFIAYEIMGGGNLAARLHSARDIATETIAGWLVQLADALQHAHQSGVVHGNLKPSAVCFDTASNIYVTDFAIAGPENAGLALLGAPAYMAPEQWDGMAPQPASDQYALAVLAYLLLGGVRPYEGQETPETRTANLQQAPIALHQQALAHQQRKLSPLVSRVVQRALAARAADRYASIADFGRELSLALRSGASAGAGAQVFISYRRETSSGWVAFLSDQLERDHGISSFVDTLGLDGAVKFPARIQRAIENCSVFVCVLGADTLKSPYVRQEIELAFRDGKRMIPVMLEGFVASEAEFADPAMHELLTYDGVKLLDRQNIYVRAAVGELAQQIRVTLVDLARSGPAAPSRH
ncbi:protein kinase [Variovorax sp. J22R133]|uniref:protein kinase domain-containing protein n=1 Tax=Variovorax brevis TaxID=3053503 RepID=UPI00257737A0|nr:protein kinase [Variovorax sp. J22R133]MDM0111313.1 protein kinase [Variovorax sp. J22R133]